MRRTNAAVRTYVRRRVDSQDTDDVVADVFVIARRRLRDVPEDPLPWLLGVARRVMVNRWRGAAHRRSPTPPITQHDPVTLTSRLLEDPEIAARERVAAILVAVYAQPIVRVARFRIDQITITDTETTIQLAATPVALPKPIAAAIGAWLDQRQATMPPLATPSPWLFPGNPPSRPIGDPSLSRQLKLVGIECNQDCRAALLHLAAEILAAVLSDLVGIHVNTAGAWADMAGRRWGDYPSLREPSN